MRVFRKHWLVLAALAVVALAASIAPACDDACNDPACTKPSDDSPQYERQPWIQTSTIGGGEAQSQPSGCTPPKKSWKVFPDKFANVVQDVQKKGRDPNDMYLYLGHVAITTLLFVGIVVMVRRGAVTPALRKFYQLAFLVLWVFIIAQCLCAVKEFAVLIMYGFHDRMLFGLCTAWMGVMVVLLTLAVRGKARSPFCFWVCPLGTVQDLTETGFHKHISSWVRIAILVVLAGVLVGVLWWNPPPRLNEYGGPALAMLAIIFSILALAAPRLDQLFRKFIFVSLVGWFALCIWGMWGEIENWTSGPWCVLGVGNYKNPLVLTFLVVMATSLVMPRAWCNYVCPNRGLFEWLGGSKGRHGGKGDTA